MKKITLCLCALMCLLLTACSSGPEKTVAEYCDSFKNIDASDLSENVGEDAFLSEDTAQFFVDYIEEISKKTEYEIKSVDSDGETAAVEVEFTYADASPVITEFMEGYLAQALPMVFSGSDDEEMELLAETEFKKALENAEVSTATKTVNFNCVKIDGGWKIEETPEEMTDILSGNIIGTLEELFQS